MESADPRLIFPVGFSPYGTRRKEGNAAVAMDPGFRADLGTAGAVLWAARPYLNDDSLHRRLLAERGGIAAGDLHELADRRRRGRSIRDMSIGERREADPGFVSAPPARRPEEVRIQAVGCALDALAPAGPSRDVPVGAGVDIDSDIHADAFDRAPMPEPPVDPRGGWERACEDAEFGAAAEIDRAEPLPHTPAPAMPDPAADYIDRLDDHVIAVRQAGGHPFADP